jgi:type IV secretion system protein VirB6
VFSLAVLNVMVAIAMKVVGAVAAAFLLKWAASSAGWDTGEGIDSMSLQQGGIGLVMSTLIISAPPMAAAFFQGTLGQFSPYSAMGALERGGTPEDAKRGYIPDNKDMNSYRALDHGKENITKVNQHVDGQGASQSQGSRGLAKS